MPVHIVADSSAKLAGVRAVLEKKFAVTSELLGGISPQRSDVGALVVKADLRTVESICTLKKLFGTLSKVRKRIFLVDDTAHLSVSQAYALGATSVLVGPLNQTKLLAELADQLSADASASVDSGDAQATASAGEIALASMFSALASGT